MTASEKWVLQLCHGYEGPFLDCARQYAALFAGTPYKVCTVYLTGAPSDEVTRGSASDEVLFLGYDSKAVRGLKLAAVRKIRRIALSHHFVFCITHRSKPTYVALLGTSLPVISVHHAFGDYDRLSRRLFINRFRKRLLLLGVSDAVRDDIRACLPGWPGDRIQTLYNRINLPAVQAELVDRSSARAYLGLPADPWIVGNVGRLHRDKDQATLIRGFAQALPELPSGCLLAVMGSGPLESALKALAAELGLTERIRFLGQIDNGRRYFRAFDVFALTSDHEPFGMVLLEAMAADLPVVCTDCGGGREVVEQGGQLFPLGDYRSLAAALVALSSGGGDGKTAALKHALTTRFSDSSARQCFWTLPFVQAFR
ncbi:glycosyltransferase [Stutzerimonas chloritidismutans]|uniref:glycosyltransferase n=1 Tax=Stutzerimonas chloritidismutans TaxID=203192 RepID=UPI003F1797B9